MLTLDKVLDNAMELSPDERDTLIEILKKRRIEERRNEIVNEIHEARGEYSKGNLKALTANEIISELHNFLSDSEEKES